MQSKPRPLGGRILTVPVAILTVLVLAGFYYVGKRYMFGIGTIANINPGYPWGIWVAFDIIVGNGNFAAGIKYPDYNTWNIGIGFTWKVFTLDLRYSDTDLSKGNCSAFTSAFNATGTTNVTPINPGGTGSNWCGAAGIAKLSFDLTAMSNLK